MGKAFTLVETLVAMTLFVIIMAMLLEAMNHVSRVVSDSSAEAEVTRTAREALGVMGRDLAFANPPWSSSNTNSLQFVTNPSVAGLSTQYLNHDSLFWQTPIGRNAGNGNGGNLAIVGYFVQHSSDVPQRYQLRRVYVEPQNSSGAANADFLIYSNPNAWVTTTTYQDYAPSTATADAANAEQGWTADGVLEMWVQCLDKFGAQITDASGTSLNFDSRKGGYSNTSNKLYYPANFSTYPAFVQVVLVCVAPNELARMTSLPTPPAATPANFSTLGSTFVAEALSQNPGIKSVTAFTRTFRINAGN
ncbi:MAG: hypothetical protein WDO13_07970 [Verrucomicrobiota bacterium]